MNITSKQLVCIIGLQFSENTPYPEYYIIVHIDDTYTDTTLAVNNKVAFFNEKQIKLYLRQKCKFIVNNKRQLLDSLDMVCCLQNILEVIEKRNEDNGAFILDYLNTCFDILQVANIALSDANKKLLYNFADHLTFNREFGSYLDENKIDTQTVIDAIYWLTGAVIFNSFVVTDIEMFGEINNAVSEYLCTIEN
ncbi:MAG: hypothetical protein JNM36_14425 [Chitinophagales bacterium]|nr:hypothetical protein [Chitinophagales bacterium]